MEINLGMIFVALVIIAMFAGLIYLVNLFAEYQKASIKYQNKPIQYGDIFAKWNTEERRYDYAFIVTEMISEDYFEANLYSIPARVRNRKTILSSIFLNESEVLDRYTIFLKTIKFSEGEIRKIGFERI